jgi:hypothetical protein
MALSQVMAADPQRISELVARALTDGEPMGSLQSITELRHQLDLLERTHVARALEAGHTFTAIAEPLAISRQAAHRRYRDLAVAPAQQRGPTLSPAARAALAHAREEAVRFGAPNIESEHVLLAVARAGGLDLDTRAPAPRRFTPRLGAEPAGLDPALRARLVRAHGPLSLDDLLHAALDDPRSGARRLLERLGIPAETVYDAIRESRAADPG